MVQNLHIQFSSLGLALDSPRWRRVLIMESREATQKNEGLGLGTKKVVRTPRQERLRVSSLLIRSRHPEGSKYIRNTYRLWARKYTNMTYFGVFGAPKVEMRPECAHRRLKLLYYNRAECSCKYLYEPGSKLLAKGLYNPNMEYLWFHFTAVGIVIMVRVDIFYLGTWALRAT